jgi:quercetin dioxygenase-like cupin family protein
MTLRRRRFVGCVLCSIGGLMASEVAAQTTGGLRRKVLQQVEGPVQGYVTLVVEIEVDAGAVVARHTHPGIESSYMINGTGELLVDGQSGLQLKPGDAFQIPAAVPHSFRSGDRMAKIAATFVVEKDKPLASPA